jgi:capsular polysaccharide biosynthesis protein
MDKPNILKSFLSNLLKLVQRSPLFAGQCVSRPWPANLLEKDRAFFAKNNQYQLPPSWLLFFREASVYWDGAVFHGLRLYPESLVQPDKKEHNWRGLLAMHLLPKNRLSTKCQYILIHDAWSESYYHWMADALPRLLTVREQVKHAVLLLPETYRHDYQKQTLAAFEVSSIQYLKPNIRYSVPRLLMPSRLARIASYNPAVMNSLRTLLLTKFPLLPYADLGSHIYISRASAKRRKVLNEVEVAAYMKQQGFAVVQLENYSFAEQASIMARARCLVSIHGAGLTNMLFMPAGSQVLELQMQDDGTNHYFYTLAADLDISYYYQFCTPNDATLSVQDADLTVNIADLSHTLTRMLRERQTLA